MKYKNFLMRLMSLAIILVALNYYNGIASARQSLVDANQKQIEEVEAHNASVMALENGEEDAFADGSYEGVGVGFGGDIKVEVVVSEGKISEVKILEAPSEDAAYLEMARELTETIVKKQSTEVDTVSGATFSSRGILEAAEAALDKAVNQ